MVTAGTAAFYLISYMLALLSYEWAKMVLLKNLVALLFQSELYVLVKMLGVILTLSLGYLLTLKKFVAR